MIYAASAIAPTVPGQPAKGASPAGGDLFALSMLAAGTAEGTAASIGDGPVQGPARQDLAAPGIAVPTDAPPAIDPALAWLPAVDIAIPAPLDVPPALASVVSAPAAMATTQPVLRRSTAVAALAVGTLSFDPAPVAGASAPKRAALAKPDVSLPPGAGAVADEAQPAPPIARDPLPATRPSVRRDAPAVARPDAAPAPAPLASGADEVPTPPEPATSAPHGEQAAAPDDPAPTALPGRKVTANDDVAAKPAPPRKAAAEALPPARVATRPIAEAMPAAPADDDRSDKVEAAPVDRLDPVTPNPTIAPQPLAMPVDLPPVSHPPVRPTVPDAAHTSIHAPQQARSAAAPIGPAVPERLPRDTATPASEGAALAVATDRPAPVATPVRATPDDATMPGPAAGAQRPPAPSRARNDRAPLPNAPASASGPAPDSDRDVVAPKPATIAGTDDLAPPVPERPADAFVRAVDPAPEVAGETRVADPAMIARVHAVAPPAPERPERPVRVAGAPAPVVDPAPDIARDTLPSDPAATIQRPTAADRSSPVARAATLAAGPTSAVAPDQAVSDPATAVPSPAVAPLAPGRVTIAPTRAVGATPDIARDLVVSDPAAIAPHPAAAPLAAQQSALVMHAPTRFPDPIPAVAGAGANVAQQTAEISPRSSETTTPAPHVAEAEGVIVPPLAADPEQPLAAGVLSQPSDTGAQRLRSPFAVEAPAVRTMPAAAPISTTVAPAAPGARAPVPLAAADTATAARPIAAVAAPVAVDGAPAVGPVDIVLPTPAVAEPRPAFMREVSGNVRQTVALRPQAAVQPQPAAGITAPAAQVFGAAMHAAAGNDERKRAEPVDPAIAAAPVQAPVREVAATADAGQPMLDMRQDGWPTHMIDHIEALRDAANATDTRIRLVPDALGAIDIAVKTVGDAIHVRFAAEDATTRTMIEDAQPHLAEIAQERGLRIGQTIVEAAPANSQSNAGQQNAGQQNTSQQNQPASPGPAGNGQQQASAQAQAQAGQQQPRQQPQQQAAVARQPAAAPRTPSNDPDAAANGRIA